MNAEYSYTVESQSEFRDQEEVCSFLTDHWGDVNIASKGKLIDASKITRVIARDSKGRLVGLATFKPDKDGSCELVSIDATIQGVGIGSALLQLVEHAAKEYGCDTIWLITTNNNTHAQSFYEHKGFERVAIHENALALSRQLKPGIPTHDDSGRSIKDEWEYQKTLV